MGTGVGLLLMGRRHMRCDQCYVIGLDLSFKLSGHLYSNSSLFGLHRLQRLNLAYNDFKFAPIPSGLDRLPSLTHLNLCDTCFSGQIPWELSRLTRLVSLDLSTQQFCPFVDFINRRKLERPTLKVLIQNLTSLMELYLDGVDLSTQGSEWSQVLPQTLPKLRALSLSSCRLSGPIHSSLSQLVFLSELHLDDNDLFVEAPKFLANFSHLKTLSLRSCGLYGEFPNGVFQLSNLQNIDVSGNYALSGQLPNFPHINAFKVMLLHDTNFSGGIPISIEKLRFLMKLRLSHCKFSGSIPPSLTKLTRLTELDLSSNSFSGSIPSSLTNLTQLTVLYLSSNTFTGSIPSYMANLTYLTDLDLSVNNFTGSIPSSLANLTHLVFLDLSINRFTGSVPLFNEDNVPNLAGLNLYDNLLDGKIHSSLFTLPSLLSLQLLMNQFSGRLELFPNSSVSSLERMDLSRNKLNGQIAKSISQLSGLGYLDLSSNDFNGTIKLDMFGNLKNLWHLDLSDNQFSVEAGNSSSALPQLQALSLRSCNLKEFPDLLRTQEELQILDLSNNQIQGHVPSWIWKRTLYNVDLSYNGIVDFESAFTDHSNNDSMNNSSSSTLNLFYLTLISCNLSAFPEFLKDLNELAVLDLSNNNISGILPNWIWKKPLFSLNLSYNSLNTLERPLSLFSSSSLSTLDLRCNKLQGPIPIPSSSVTFFSISNNRFVGGILESICKLSSLQIFDASYNNLIGSIPECLGNMDTLSVLDVQENRFHGMLQHFTNASNLKTIKINGNIIEGQVPWSLANCTSLEVLDLGKNKIFDTFPFWLGKLPMLRVLVLHSNRFYGSIEHPQTFDEFLMLQIMDISSNRFTGNLPTGYFRSLRAMMSRNEQKSSEPEYIGGSYYKDSVIIMNKGLEMELVRILTIFTALDLSNNRFQGEIPEVIGDLISLVVLNLSHNDLTGQIPSLIGNMAQLESLDLSRNKFTGQIPLQLTSLTFLEFLNLSHNHLEGHIPQGHQLETFSNTSYNENPGLCGFPLSRKCKDDSDDKPPPNEKSNSTNDLKFDWKSILMGYGCGTIIGFVIGYVIFKDEWLRRTFRMAPIGR